MSENFGETNFITKSRSIVNTLQQMSFPQSQSIQSRFQSSSYSSPQFQYFQSQSPVQLSQTNSEFNFQPQPNSSPTPTVQNEMIRVSVDKEFEIALPANETTGFKWDVTVSPGLTIVNEIYKLKCEPGIVGCGGEDVWTLKGTKGTHIFKGIYQRSWEKIPAQNYNITIIAS